jgi:CBS domain-containing protein
MREHARITTLVRDVMTRRTLTIAPEASLAAAIAVMRENVIRHLPVVDNMGRLAGIITDRDLRSAALAPNSCPPGSNERSRPPRMCCRKSG